MHDGYKVQEVDVLIMDVNQRNCVNLLEDHLQYVAPLGRVFFFVNTSCINQNALAAETISRGLSDFPCLSVHALFLLSGQEIRFPL
jgi:hypothetical protein